MSTEYDFINDEYSYKGKYPIPVRYICDMCGKKIEEEDTDEEYLDLDDVMEKEGWVGVGKKHYCNKCKHHVSHI